MGINFEVDKTKCIGCGLCSEDCISRIIQLDENNLPYITDEDKCLKCQHCLAICPQGAISVLGKHPENSDSIDGNIDAERLLNLIKSRKSYRQYKPENLPADVLGKLKNMLKYPPTGCNFHNLHISLVDDIEVMDKFRNMTNDKIKNLFLSKKYNFITEKFSSFKSSFLNGEDIIFRNAPHMIVISAPINAPCGVEDGIINLSYFELYAQSLKVGTLWCGFAEICLKMFPDLCEYLEIPDGFRPIYVMLFGNPAVMYSRCAQPEEYQISIVQDKKIKMSLIRRIKRYFWNFIRG